MRITILGAGAVGGYFGGRLAEAGIDVTFLVRGKRAKQLTGTGLRIKSPFGDYHLANPQLAEDSREIGSCDLVILAVKNYHLEQAIPQIKTLVDSGAKVLPLLNGIEHFDKLAQEFGQDAVLGGMCQIISTLDSEGTIHHTTKLHRITFGPRTSSQAAFCQQLAQVLQTANLQFVLSPEIWVPIWIKYSFITAYSGITAASRLSIDQILRVEAAKTVYTQALQEMWQLAKASGTTLPEDYVEKNLQTSHNFEPGSTSSMHQDLRKGLPLEVESLQGAALRRAKTLGIAVPTVNVLYGLLKPFESGAHFG